MLLCQLEKDQLAVDEVREMVTSEEVVMKRETQIVQDYADVSLHLDAVFIQRHSCKLDIRKHAFLNER